MWKYLIPNYLKGNTYFLEGKWLLRSTYFRGVIINGYTEL